MICAVSYTHLDVYKRQVIFNGAVSIFLPGVAKKLSDILGEDLYIVFLNYDYAVIHPVSIIRPEEIRSLIASVKDVYKRQDWRIGPGTFG